MATRLRKTRRQRGSRYCGWGQVGQHRASGHKGGLGASGQLKHHYSGMLKTDPDHFGHGSMRPPRSGDAKKWAAVRDLDAMARDGKVDLAALGVDKLLGGGSVSGAYAVTVARCTPSAREKVAKAGGRIEGAGGRSDVEKDG